MALEFLAGELSNLAATVIGQPINLAVQQMAGSSAMGDALTASANNNEMPADTAHRVRQAKAGTGNSFLDGQSYLDGGLYQAGLLPADGNPDTGITGIPGALLQHAVDAIDTVAQNPVQVISQLSWPGTATAVLNDALSVFGQHIPAIGGVLANLPTPTRDTMLADILAGNFGGLAADAITGILIPNLANAALGLLAKQMGQNFGLRPPQPQLTEYYWPDDTAPTFTRQPPTSQVNVGHAGHMAVKLANIPFELPPATTSVLPIHGGVQGQVAPGAEVGVRFVHVQNYATLLIPGGAPVYQSLGIQGLMLEFVGAFLGWDQNRLLNQDLHNVGFFDPNNPDPLYTDPAKKGGAWQVGRVFLDNAVKKGTPVDFEIFSGVVTIKYQVIVTNYTRWYRDDSRVYYKFQCFAVGGVEGGSDADTTLVQRATKENIKAGQRTVSTATDGTGTTAAGALAGAGSNVVDTQPGARIIGANSQSVQSFTDSVATITKAVNAFEDAYTGSYPFNAPGFVVGQFFPGVLLPQVSKADWQKITDLNDAAETMILSAGDSYTALSKQIADSSSSSANQGNIPSQAQGTSDSTAGAQKVAIDNAWQQIQSQKTLLNNEFNKATNYVSKSGGAK